LNSIRKKYPKFIYNTVYNSPNTQSGELIGVNTRVKSHTFTYTSISVGWFNVCQNKVFLLKNMESEIGKIKTQYSYMGIFLNWDSNDVW